MRGRKTPEEKKEEVKALMLVNPEASSTEIAKIVDLPHRTVFDIQKEFENTDEFAAVRQKKKEEFIANAWRVVEKALTLTEKRFDKALSDEEAIQEMIKAVNDNEDLTKVQKKAISVKLNSLQMTNIRDIAVALGTIYDKQALASGEPTQITESHKSIQELQKDTEKLLTELKQITG